MDTIKALALLGTLCIISSGCFIYLSKSNNNEKEKFLAQNKTIDKAIQELREVTIFALNSQKLNIEEATFGEVKLDKNQIQEIYDSIKNQVPETEKDKIKQKIKNL